MYQVILSVLMMGIVLAGCGGADDSGEDNYDDNNDVAATPKAGDSCDMPGLGLCDSPNLALLCEKSVWRLLPCYGPSGCTELGSLYCDMTLNDVGDACAESMKDKGWCSAFDPKEVLVCDGHTTQVFAVCEGQCVEENGMVGCPKP